MNPGTVSLSVGASTPFGGAYLVGSGSDWSFQWTTNAGGGGDLNLGKPVTFEDIVYGTNNYTNYYTGGNVQEPSWNGPFFTGSLDEAIDWLLLSSKTFGVESSMWSTTRGNYFEPIQGNEYYSTMAYDFDLMGYRIQHLNVDNGWQINLPNKARRYNILEQIGGGLYITPNIFHRAQILYHAHTHPNNNPPGSSDSEFVGLYGIFGLVVGWNNERFWYGRRR
jgi:hypothetical protein